MTTGDMSLEEARKILGDSYENVSDKTLRHDIDTARLLADIFFDMVGTLKLDFLHHRKNVVEAKRK